MGQDEYIGKINLGQDQRIHEINMGVTPFLPQSVFNHIEFN